MHFYTFHPAKHKLETYQLKPLERLAYRELMDIYYDSEKPLTTNIDDLAWRMGYETDELVQALQLVLDKFFVIKQLKGDTEPMYHHPRLDYEIKAYQSSEKKNGTKGTRKVQATTNELQATTSEVQTSTSETTSHHTNKNPTDIKKANMIQALRNQGVRANTRMSVGQLQALFDEHCKPTTSELQATTSEVQTSTSPVLAGKTINHKPVTSNQEPINLSPQTPQGAGVDMAGTHETTEKTTQKTKPTPTANKTLNVAFDEFWDAYDKKINPKKCEPMWNKLSDKDRTDIMAYIPKYKQAQPDKQYRLHPQTFLNNRSWEDEIIERQPKQQPPQPQFGGADDPLAVNQHWANYTPPPSREENYKIAMERLAQAQAQANRPQRA